MKSLALLAAAVLLTAATPVADPFDRAVQALGRGDSAARSGDRRLLSRAAVALRASGAAPVAGDEDLAARWLHRGLHRAGVSGPAVERDRALGPGYRNMGLPAGTSARFNQTFLAGQRARIAVVPTGRADYAMVVTDDNEAIVCRASPGHDRCDWVPTYTARFKIELRNPGRAQGKYYLVVQ
jgi:hypothetical protein